MHIGVNALSLDSQASGLARTYAKATLGEFGRHDGADGNRFLAYAWRSTARGLALPAAVPVIPPFPGAKRMWEDWRLHARVFADNLDVLFCPLSAMPRWCLLPTAIAIHDVRPLRGESGGTAWAASLRRRLPVSLARAKAIVVSSKRLADELVAWNAALPERPSAPPTLGARLREWIGLSDDGEWRLPDLLERIRVVPWGIEDVFFRHEWRREVKKRLAQQGLGRYVLVPSLEGDNPRLEDMLKGWYAAVSRLRLPHDFVVLADSPDRRLRSLGATAKSIGMSTRVRAVFTDSVEAIAQLYQGADAVLLAYNCCDAGLQLGRALAVGAPAIVHDVDGFFPPDSPGSPNVLRIDSDKAADWRQGLEKFLGDNAPPPRPAERTALPGWREHAEGVLAVCHEVVEADKARGENLRFVK